ncbi:hypothetical protein [Citrobacter braakii]|uniref:hypothetical protein n=1 Tax=Citrobacter braakii TaxID=57706 RepID=UPI00403947CA
MSKQKPTIANYPAVQQINFYVNEASSELIAERRNYLESYLLPTWKNRLEQMQSWKEHSATDLDLLSEYQQGVEFLTKALKKETSQ